MKDEQIYKMVSNIEKIVSITVILFLIGLLFTKSIIVPLVGMILCLSGILLVIIQAIFGKSGKEKIIKENQ